MLEWKLVEGSDQSLQVVTTLQSTPSGKRNYQALCDRQMHLRELVGHIVLGFRPFVDTLCGTPSVYIYFFLGKWNLCTVLCISLHFNVWFYMCYALIYTSIYFFVVVMLILPGSSNRREAQGNWRYQAVARMPTSTACCRQGHSATSSVCRWHSPVSPARVPNSSSNCQHSATSTSGPRRWGPRSILSFFL